MKITVCAGDDTRPPLEIVVRAPQEKGMCCHVSYWLGEHQVSREDFAAIAAASRADSALAGSVFLADLTDIHQQLLDSLQPREIGLVRP